MGDPAQSRIDGRVYEGRAESVERVKQVREHIYCSAGQMASRFFGSSSEGNKASRVTPPPPGVRASIFSLC